MYKKLIEYLPAFMQGFAEMKEITNAEDAEMDRLQTGVRQILSNAFIEDADEETISLLEENKTEIFYTYNGNLTFSCDGYSITYTQGD